MSLRTSAHTGVAIRNPCLPLGEGGSRIPRKRETDEGKSRAATSSARPAPVHYGMIATGDYYNFDSLRGAPLLSGEGFGERIATPALRRWFAMTCVIR